MEAIRPAVPARPHRISEAAAVRDGHPTDPAWRADARARSVHSRLPEIQPLEEGDGDKAAELCAEMTRDLLGDFAPSLLLLPANERQRVQALLAYAVALFDFARRGGLPGERLCEIDRFAGNLDRALDGERVGQAIFLRMAREHARRRWPLEALEELGDCARRRALRVQPATVVQVEAEARGVVGALGRALLENGWNAEVQSLAAALFRLQILRRLGLGMAARRCPLPAEELALDPDRALGPNELEAAVRRECARLRPRLLRAPRGLVDMPVGYRRAWVFALLAAVRFLSDLEDGDTGPLAPSPRLPTRVRLGLLLRARWTQRG
jgi:phytoene/squalene synthetase